MSACSLTIGLWLVAMFSLTMMGTSEAAVTCMDAHGKPVDWFIVYKLPDNYHSQVPQVRAGYGQMYMDVNNPVLKLSPVWLNDTKHAIAYTLQQIYQNSGSQDVAYVMYNDEKPDSKSKTESFGHAKGDLAFDGTSGFWLVHSTPRFPSNSSSIYNWPDNAREYGQSFICVTYGYDQFEAIGQQLLYNYPWVYDSNLPPSLVRDTPSIVATVEKQHVTCPPWNRTASLTSVGGQTFISFAKFKTFGHDLYADWLAPYFSSNMYTETWQDGAGDLNSSCTGYKVNNINKLNLPGGEAFADTRDHSKWAVTTRPGSTWTCIGDINRQCHQMLRAGGTVCFENTDVHKTFLGAVTAIQKCPQQTYCPEIPLVSSEKLRD